MTKINAKEWLVESIKNLKGKSEYPFLEAQVLLAFVVNKSREWLVCHPEFELDESQFFILGQLLQRLSEGEPLPYLVGKQAFFGLDFFVTPDVLIPRPETELLVEECIQWFEEHPRKRSLADVGTGSGIIAVCLADHFEDLNITAIDISDKALDVARKNAGHYHVGERIAFEQADLLSGCSQRFHVIAANLPYIPSAKLAQLAVSKYEPTLALDGGAEGLDLISRLLEQCKECLEPGGLILLEIEAEQSESVANLAKKYLPEAKITLLFDLAKHPRILKIQL